MYHTAVENENSRVDNTDALVNKAAYVPLAWAVGH